MLDIKELYPEIIDRDMTYMLEMYPYEAKIIKGMTDEMLNLWDYATSFIYDEYPDKYLFLRLADKITKLYIENYKDDRNKDWINQITRIILANEIVRRRKRKKYW